MYELITYTDDGDIDKVKALLAYLLIKDSELDVEYIYAMIFGNGHKIIWN